MGKNITVSVREQNINELFMELWSDPAIVSPQYQQPFDSTVQLLGRDYFPPPLPKFKDRGKNLSVKEYFRSSFSETRWRSSNRRMAKEIMLHECNGVFDQK